jgi:hypothetical protein
MELGRHMPQLKSKYGVDFVFFDGEELIFDKDAPIDDYFLGSEHFAKDYAVNRQPHTYRWGVLLDMVGDKNLDLPVDPTSWSWEDTKPLVQDIWTVARNLGVKEFRNQLGPIAVQDDHIPLHDIAGIPTVDIIDFDYPQWHTTQDTPANCSPLSLAKVGWVVLEWLKQAQ